MSRGSACPLLQEGGPGGPFPVAGLAPLQQCPWLLRAVPACLLANPERTGGALQGGDEQPVLWPHSLHALWLGCCPQPGSSCTRDTSLEGSNLPGALLTIVCVDVGFAPLRIGGVSSDVGRQRMCLIFKPFR